MASISLQVKRLLYASISTPPLWRLEYPRGTYPATNTEPNGHSIDGPFPPATDLDAPLYVERGITFPGDLPLAELSGSGVDTRYGEFAIFATGEPTAGRRWEYGGPSIVPRVRVVVSGSSTSKTRIFQFTSGTISSNDIGGNSAVVLAAGITTYDGHAAEKVEWDFGDGTTLTTYPSGVITAPDDANGHTTVCAHADVSHTYTCPGNYSVHFKVFDTAGRWRLLRTSISITATLPTAVISSSIDGSTVTWSGIGSTTPNGVIETYLWTFHDGATATGTTVVYEYPSDGTYSVTLRVTDSCGLQHARSVSVTVEGVTLFGSFTDHAGTVYTAVNSGSNVPVSRFKTGTASREILYTLTGYKNPSLFKIDGLIYLCATERATGTVKLFKSIDGGKTFSMPVTVLDSTYKNATMSPLISGGAVVGAIKTNKVWFVRSNNLTDWGSPVVEIAPLENSKNVHIHQQAISGSIALIATDGIKIATSRDGGKTWTAL